jgi:hypothetical protein
VGLGLAVACHVWSILSGSTRQDGPVCSFTISGSSLPSNSFYKCIRKAVRVPCVFSD